MKYTYKTKKYSARAKTLDAILAKGELEFSDEQKIVKMLEESKMTGKLEGFYSLSTSVVCNEGCTKRREIPGSICEKCYAVANTKRYTGLGEKLAFNYSVLSKVLLSFDAWKAFKCTTTTGAYRIESFGDVDTVIQARNYIRLMNSHKNIHFSIWTKVPAIWDKALRLEGGKPENSTFLLSSLYINTIADCKKWWFIDYTFTVYDREHQTGKTMDCIRNCAVCMRCYHKASETDKGTDIAEFLKGAGGARV